MARMTLPPVEAMNIGQRAVFDEAVGGIRGRAPAPLAAWIRNPELARRAQKLGEAMRYGTSLDPALSELAILVTARHWTSHYEWSVHKAAALKAGLPPSVIAAIAARTPPPFDESRQATVFEVSTTLLDSKQLPQALYDRAIATLGEAGLVDLIGILGYYALVSMTLNCFEIGLPEALAPEL